jgi:hypothetical protein
MPNVILQPASGVKPRKHYIDTVVNPVGFSRLARYMPVGELAALKTVTEADSICAWGIVPSGESKWKFIRPGDTVLFARDNHYYSSSTVVGRLHNQQLATHLWDTDSSGNTWEYMYFFLPPEDINISYEHLNNVLKTGQGARYASNYNPQGINVLRDQNAEAALEIIYGQTPPTSLQETTRFIDGRESLDAVSTALVRKEQGYLRDKLLGSAPTGQCGICGKDLPAKFLVAAHIKKRAKCTDQEKADIPSIAMPMCLMGCDALYEAGYLTIDGGHVQVTQVTHPALTETLQSLAGNSCLYWSSKREKYFRWHKQNIFKARHE